MESSSQVLKLVDEITEKDPTTCVVNGITFKMRRVSKLMVLDASRKIKIPRPPKVFIEEKGREEENPNDPEYLERKTEAEYERSMLIMHAYIALGTKPISIPEDIEPIESNGWLEELSEIGLGTPSSDRVRYLMWVKYVGVPDEKDLNDLLTEVMRYSGITLEGDVKEVADRFRDNESGNSNK